MVLNRASKFIIKKLGGGALRVFVFACAAGGKGGQVFTLTQFNEGCLSLCVFAFVRTCFHGEYPSKDTNGRMERKEVPLFIIRSSSQVSSFPEPQREHVRG